MTRDDANPDLFYAMCPNLGLLGVVSTITLECVDAFDIDGQRGDRRRVETCPVDLFGDGDAGPARRCERFLPRSPTSPALEWWPQRGADRVLTWQARQIAAEPGFKPKPYTQFGDDPETQQHLVRHPLHDHRQPR